MIQIMNRNNWLLAFMMIIFIAAFIVKAWSAVQQEAYQKLTMTEKDWVLIF